jgi:hypothetical protein
MGNRNRPTVSERTIRSAFLRPETQCKGVAPERKSQIGIGVSGGGWRPGRGVKRTLTDGAQGGGTVHDGLWKGAGGKCMSTTSHTEAAVDVDATHTYPEL